VFLLAILVIRPFGNVFYAGDDWAYARSVLWLHLGEGFHISKWVTASAITQVSYGALWTSVFGFSFKILNLSVISLAVLGLVAQYLTFLALGFNPKVSSVGTLALSLTPLYLGFSATFMTDVPHTVLMILAVVCYIHGLKGAHSKLLLLGGALATLAYLNRQTGIAILLAYGLTILIRSIHRRSGSQFIKSFILGLLLPGIILFLYHWWLEWSGEMTPFQQANLNGASAVLDMVQRIFSRMILYRLYQVWSYFYVILTPLVALIAYYNWKRVGNIVRENKTLFVAATVFLTIAPISVLSFADRTLTVPGDLLHGSGGFLLSDTSLWNVLVVVCSPIGAVLCAAIWTELKNLGTSHLESGAWIFVLACLASYLVLVCAFVSFVNNYFLPFFPLFILLIYRLLKPQEINIPVAVFVLILSNAVFIVSLEARARWIEESWKVADEYAAVSGVDSAAVYGPYSWYAWMHYDQWIATVTSALDSGEAPLTAQHRPKRLAQNKALYVLRQEMNHEDSEFDLSQFQVVDVRRYDTLLGEKSIFVLKRLEN